MDKLEEAEVALESMHHLSVLLMDAYKENREESGAKVVFCFYTYAVLIQNILQPCIDTVDRYLMEMKKQKREAETVV